MWGWIVAAIVSTFLVTTILWLDVEIAVAKNAVERGWMISDGKVYIITPGEVK